MNLIQRIGTAMSLLPLLSAVGCAPAVQSRPDPEAPYAPSRPPQVGDILHLPTGFFVSEEQMLRVIVDARIAYVGETHDNPASHRQELAVLRAVAERNPERTALGMEMFVPSQQKALDRWVAGELTEKEFLKESRWYDVWGLDFDYYKPLLDFARKNRIPVIALNAEKDLVKAVGRTGLEDLPAEQRESLPEMDLSDPYQRAMTEAVFGGHDAGKADISGFLRVQTLWDEAMADSIARYLEKNPDARMVVVAGGNHIRYGYGIPRRVFRRIPTSYVLVGSRELVIPESKKDRLMDIEQPPFPMPPYHFLAFTEYEDLGKEEVKLGVMLEEEEGWVKVKGVVPESAAAAAGLQEGDVLLSLNGEPLAESFDVIYAVKQKRPGDRARLVFERNGERQEAEVVFTPVVMPEGHGKMPKRGK